jgi:hypothetical protein
LIGLLRYCYGDRVITALPDGLLRTSGAPSVAVGATVHEGRDDRCRADHTIG